MMAFLALGLGAHFAAAALTIITVTTTTTTTTTTTVSACAASCYPAPSIPGQDQIQRPFGDQPRTPLLVSARPVGNFLPTVVLPAPAIPSSAAVEDADGGSTSSTFSASVTILFDASTAGTVATSRQDDTQTVVSPTTFVTGTRGFSTSSEEGLSQYADPTSEVPSYEVDPPSYSGSEVPSYGKELPSASGPPGYEEVPDYAEPPEYAEPPLYSVPSSQAAFPSDAGSYHVNSA
ncbi:hypothetical protein E4U61_003559 [Claviceps capensis]|nr:hypothetical protein E4U61_003559 [Claviceps capensis]